MGFGADFALFFVVISGLVPILILAFVVFFVLSSRGPAPLVLLPGQPFTLHARLLRPDQLFSMSGQLGSRQYGMITVRDGQLLWDPEEGERWATPISSITVLRTAGAMALTGAHLDLDIAGSGRWRMVVSDRTINRFMTNDFKRFREGRRGRDLAQYLLQNGARSGSS